MSFMPVMNMNLPVLSEKMRFFSSIYKYFPLHPYNYDLSLSKKSCFFSALFWTWYTITSTALIFIFLYSSAGNFDAIYSVLLEQVQYTVVFLSSLSTFIPIVLKRKELGALQFELFKIEADLLKMGIVPKYELKYTKRYFLLFSLTLIFELLYQAFVAQGYIGKYIHDITTHVAEYLVVIVSSEFSCFASVIEINYASMKQNINSLCEMDLNDHLYTVLKRYHDMIKLLRSLNDIFTVLFLFESSNTILTLLITSHFATRDFLSGNVLKASHHIFMCLVRVTKTWFVIHSCEKVQNEVELCDKQIGMQVIIRKTKLGKLANLFLLHFKKHEKVTFDACGMFKVDYPLLQSMLTGSMPYLTILWQMRGREAARSTEK